MKPFTHIAILGRQPELGLLELESVLGADRLIPFGRHALLRELPDLKRLGGTVKIAELLWEGEAMPAADVPLDLSALPRRESKVSFGLSVYGGRETPRSLLAAGLTLKKQLRAEGGSYRLVSPAAGTELTAAQLRHNRIIEDGFELLYVYAGGRLAVGRTVAVQDIDAYTARDHGRPARSAAVGMLPPKLAQMLINTTHADLIYDPFVGTGVIPQEALLMGRAASGSDLSEEMVEATRTNLAWLPEYAGGPLPDWTVEKADARQVPIPEGAAVVSEGYLGPNQSRPVRPDEAEALRPELLELYTEALSSWAARLPPGAEVSICAPAWRTKDGWVYLGIVDELPRLGYTFKRFLHVRTPLLYSRPDQFVGRQLLLLSRS